MLCYHCSPTAGLTILRPGKPKAFDKPAGVYLTTSQPMALMYGVRNFEYTYGYTRQGQIYFEEYFPNALESLYRGKQASLYTCRPGEVQTTQIPNEVVCQDAVRIESETVIEDVCEALLEQERLGKLVIRRYEQLSPIMLEWIRRAEAEEIRRRNLLQLGGPMAEYMRLHYPQSWADVEEEEHELLYHGSPVPELTELRPGFLSGSPVYALLYLWDREKTGTDRKWVTAWLQGGVTYYEEQFPGQLEAFYKGTGGTVYCVGRTDDLQTVPDREDMFRSTKPLPIRKAIRIPNAWEQLMEFERQGRFRCLRFTEVSSERQRELTSRITEYIRKGNHFRDNPEHARFLKRYFASAWEQSNKEE